MGEGEDGYSGKGLDMVRVEEEKQQQLYLLDWRGHRWRSTDGQWGGGICCDIMKDFTRRGGLQLLFINPHFRIYIFLQFLAVAL